jgi:hypothetical protein
MKGLKVCQEYREMVMAAVDGFISPEDNKVLKAHIKVCPGCKKYYKDLQIITKTTALTSFEAPPYLESRIMAVIRGSDKQPAFDLRPVLSFAVSFAAVAVMALFIIYRNLDNRTVTIASMPETQKAVAVKPEIKTAAIAPAPVVKNTAQDVNAQAEIPSTHGSAPAGVNMASYQPSHENIVPQYSVVKTGDASTLSAAKGEVTPIPTINGNTLLEKDKAIVANNLINPLKGQAATIRILVDAAARVKIIVYDKDARPISRILDEQKERGTYETQWYGRTDNGELVSEGVYFVYVQIGTRVIKLPIIVNK